MRIQSVDATLWLNRSFSNHDILQSGPSWRNCLAQPLPAYRGSDPYVFVCYSHADKDSVFAEIRWLQDQSFNVWYDTTGIGPGSEWNDEIARAIKGAEHFLYFITPRSVASEHCR
ncbi:MAG: TIR domain-containing protein [Pseudomonadales bacterium]|nr:TIR domain-containing protein [Pseudomonadales bacterium]